VNDVVFSPDGTRLATASHDRTARIWDTATGRTTATLTDHTGPVYNVVFSPDGTRLATAGSDRTARIRSLPPLWPQQLCARTGRNLSQAEWNEYLGAQPYRRQCPQRPSGKGAAPDAPVLPWPELP
jgi:dipeptidyl aminopeptidase/acylaminoacyl peptidase